MAGGCIRPGPPGLNAGCQPEAVWAWGAGWEWGGLGRSWVCPPRHAVRAQLYLFSGLAFCVPSGGFFGEWFWCFNSKRMMSAVWWGQSWEGSRLSTPWSPCVSARLRVPAGVLVWWGDGVRGDLKYPVFMTNCWEQSTCFFLNNP